MAKQRRDITLGKQISEKLKALREACGYSQENVYENTGINIGRIEAGKNEPSPTTIKRLCLHYNTTLGEFFNEM